MKYFVISDIHSFYGPAKASLDAAGYDKSDPNHILIVLGDVFDRGPDTRRVYDFLRSIPEDRLILIRGNHEDLYLDLLKKDYPEGHDFGNGTVKTFLQIAGIDVKEFNDAGIDERIELWQGKVLPKVKRSRITKWIKSDVWKNYFEFGDYVFVHCFIPLVNERPWLSMYEQFGRYRLSYREDWRENATEKEWQESRWGCPWMLYSCKYFEEEEKKGKILVCGHWKADDFWFELEGRQEDFNIYRGEHLIGIDAYTALSARSNVLVISEDGTFDQYGRRLPAEKEEDDGYFLSSDLHKVSSDMAHCRSGCGNLVCVRNLKAHLPKDKYITIADFKPVCLKFKR